MKHTMYLLFMLFSCVLFFSSCESNLTDSTAEELNANTRSAYCETGGSSGKECAENLINCTLRGTTLPETLPSEHCVVHTTSLKVEVGAIAWTKLCQYENQLEYIQAIAEATELYAESESRCSNTEVFTILNYSINLNTIYLSYACCPGEIIGTGGPEG